MATSRKERGRRGAVVFATAFLMLATAVADDVPWTFDGDTSRTGQSASIPDAGVLTSFATWTKTADVSTWTFAGPFSSMAPGFLLFLR